MFELLHLLGARSVIKIRKNAAPENIRGSKWRLKEAREYKKQGYRPWADENEYGMRWPEKGGKFSAVKRKFRENSVSRSVLDHIYLQKKIYKIIISYTNKNFKYGVLWIFSYN